jgi:hypothetical protein
LGHPLEVVLESLVLFHSIPSGTLTQGRKSSECVPIQWTASFLRRLRG